MQLVGLSKIPHKELLFHVPNGGYRCPKTARKLKAEGVRAGIPDYFYPVPKAHYHGLWIELKAKGGKPSKAQLPVLHALAQQRYAVVVCWGADAAFKVLSEYLDESLSRRIKSS